MAKALEPELTKTQAMLMTLPNISVLNRSLMDEAKLLIRQSNELQGLIKEYEKQQKEVKARLHEIEEEYKGKLKPKERKEFGGGFRFGTLAYVVTEKERSSLNKDLLLQNGVEPEIINMSMKVSSYTEVRVYDMAEKEE